MRSKNNNILISSCGYKICDDCIYVFLDSITNNQIIINGYEKSNYFIEHFVYKNKYKYLINYLKLNFEFDLLYMNKI